MHHVLVIDDNQDMRELVQVILEGAGYRVELAADGHSGVEMQRRQPVDLVLTDIFMPNQDGLETIAQLRKDFPKLKIIAFSGGGKTSHSHSYLLVAAEIGANAVLTKPFEQEDLLRTVRELLAPCRVPE